MGKIVIELYEKQAPETVKNFVGLAKGEKEWTDPKTGQKVKKPLYNGLIFHRVIPDFMIQGGDPLGTGVGGPGYQFKDEVTPTLKFDQPGRVAMANSGPNTNGCQFFITVKDTSWLNDKPGVHYNIFGQVIEGQDVVNEISKVARDGRDRPIKQVTINKVSVERVK